MTENLLDAIAEEAADRSARGIAAAVGAIVSSGVVSDGDSLPTVRSLARHLGVSSATVSAAWRVLASHGVIETDRRRGTTVNSSRASLAGRYWQVPVRPGTIGLDLSTGTPDESLLPRLGPVLEQMHTDVGVSSYLDDAVLPELDRVLRERWPFDPEQLTVVDGALDALDRLVSVLVRMGDRVLVDDPTFPPLIDMLELAGARIVGIPMTPSGPDLDAIGASMTQDPVAFFLQPRAHNPTGASMDFDTASKLAKILRASRIVVVEDDHSGAVSGATLHSLGGLIPDRVVHIHSFSKSHGPDLRIAAVGGAAAPIEDLTVRRQLGPSWTSRLTQRILLTMLTDDSIEQKVDVAAHTYAERREHLVEELASLGVATVQGTGLNLWLPVDDEQAAVVALAAEGIGVAPGAPFSVSGALEPHIRVSLGAVDDHRDLAVALAFAAGPNSRRQTGS